MHYFSLTFWLDCLFIIFPKTKMLVTSKEFLNDAIQEFIKNIRNLYNQSKYKDEETRSANKIMKVGALANVSQYTNNIINKVYISTLFWLT